MNGMHILTAGALEHIESENLRMKQELADLREKLAAAEARLGMAASFRGDNYLIESGAPVRNTWVVHVLTEADWFLLCADGVARSYEETQMCFLIPELSEYTWQFPTADAAFEALAAWQAGGEGDAE